MIIENIENLRKSIYPGKVIAFQSHLQLLLKFLLRNEIYIHYNGLMHTSHGMDKNDNPTYKINELINLLIRNRKRSLIDEDNKLLSVIGKQINSVSAYSTMSIMWNSYISKSNHRRLII